MTLPIYRASYHPGNITSARPFEHDPEPPQSSRDVTDRQKPILYDAKERPIYRAIGYAVRGNS